MQGIVGMGIAGPSREGAATDSGGRPRSVSRITGMETVIPARRPGPRSRTQSESSDSAFASVRPSALSPPPGVPAEDGHDDGRSSKGPSEGREDDVEMVALPPSE